MMLILIFNDSFLTSSNTFPQDKNHKLLYTHMSRDVCMSIIIPCILISPIEPIKYITMSKNNMLNNQEKLYVINYNVRVSLIYMDSTIIGFKSTFIKCRKLNNNTWVAFGKLLICKINNIKMDNTLHSIDKLVYHVYFCTNKFTHSAPSSLTKVCYRNSK